MGTALRKAFPSGGPFVAAVGGGLAPGSYPESPNSQFNIVPWLENTRTLVSFIKYVSCLNLLGLGTIKSLKIGTTCHPFFS